MYFLDNNSGIATMPPLKETQSTTPLWFTEGDGNKGISWPGEDWFNIQQAEQLALLDAAGIRPDKGKLNQLTLAIRAIIGQEALLKTQALAEIAAAGKGSQEKARTHLGLGKLATQDGIEEATLHRKGIVQLSSATHSADETTAATPKAVNERVNTVVDNAPSDLDTLNKLAQAISNNPTFAESVTQLLSQKLAKNENGADILDKNQFVKNLGLTEKFFGRVLRIKKITKSQTYHWPEDVAAIDVTICGAGGGGGAGSSSPAGHGSAGSGGGGGGWARSYYQRGSIPAAVAIEIGTGGQGGVANGQQPTGGGPSLFGDLMTARGGANGLNGPVFRKGSQPMLVGNGGGGDASGGNLFSSRGGSGTPALFLGISHESGAGGDSVFSFGAPPLTDAHTVAGIAGIDGAGGGGAFVIENSAGANGDNGGDGVCLIVEYSE